jgi:hypothetical protein
MSGGTGVDVAKGSNGKGFSSSSVMVVLLTVSERRSWCSMIPSAGSLAGRRLEKSGERGGVGASFGTRARPNQRESQRDLRSTELTAVG